ncbi:Hypothetical predicted protein [Octopus vulgaris]|uniref:Uncharacterized protein n=2 Tax=Octopus TaxID=6643 RepID=A0AA36F438_OCTVU|nr:uncharacterized protein LOC115212097 isoform X5 [Octopus sinensis]CAI9723230.1 Hypothetical predicted protein [Octopus vulgaris]
MQATGVFTWRQPMDVSLYPPVGNPCAYLLENALCYIISGLLLLVVGVIITSLTFQNLEDYKNEHVNRYAGPVLIGAGILVIARGALSHLCPQRSQFARQRSLLRRYVRELYTRPILGLRNDSSNLCDIRVSESQDIAEIQECPRPTRPTTPTFLSAPATPRPFFFGSRLRMYSDDPPPYDVVMNQDYVVSETVTESMASEETAVNLDDEEAFQSADEECCLEAPPSYDEFMRTSRL